MHAGTQLETVHMPRTQALPGGHIIMQELQCVLLLERSKQPSLQQVWLPVQAAPAAPAHPQLPEVHVSPGRQFTPQAPQFDASLLSTVQRPSQQT